MITLKINGKKVKIPVVNELTVKQYSELVRKELNIINYLSVVLGKTYKEAFNSKVKGIEKLQKRIGTIQDYTKMPFAKHFIFDDELYETKKIEVSTVGQRFMIEEHASKLENEELLCYILAVGIAENPMDYEEINKLKDKLLQESYIKVLPVAFFLANRFLIGRKSGMNFLRMSKQLINTKAYELRQALRNFRLISTTMKYKRFVHY